MQHVSVFHSFLLLNNIPLYGYMYHISFIHSSADGHSGCSHFLAIMHNVAVNNPGQVFMWTYVFLSLAYTLRCGTAGSYSSNDFKKLLAWLQSCISRVTCEEHERYLIVQVFKQVLETTPRRPTFFTSSLNVRRPLMPANFPYLQYSHVYFDLIQSI